MAVFNGVVYGLILAVLIGPVFFTLIQTSIEKGFKKAILVAVGIVISDFLYINLSYFGLSQLLDKENYKEWIGYSGGIILLAFGLFSLFKSRKAPAIQKSVDAKGFFRYIIKGFAINGISPFVLLFWLGTMSMATLEYGYQGLELVLFFGAILFTVLTTDIIKAYLAGKLRALLTPQLFNILNIIVGLALIVFGIRMFTYSW